ACERRAAEFRRHRRHPGLAPDEAAAAPDAAPARPLCPETALEPSLPEAPLPGRGGAKELADPLPKRLGIMRPDLGVADGGDRGFEIGFELGAALRRVPG